MQILTKYKGGSLGNAPVVDALLSPKDAVQFFDDFEQTIPSATRNTLTVGTGCTGTVGTLDTGVAIALHGSTASQTVTVAHTSACVKVDAGRVIAFEAYVSASVVSLTNSGSSFIGFSQLAAATASVTTAGAGDGTNSAIGFAFRQDGALATVVANGATVATAQVLVATPVATASTGKTYRLGMVIKNNTSVDFYVNGNLITTVTASLDTTNLMRLHMDTIGGTSTTALRGLYVDYVSYAYGR
jgi:hypothetical protein